MNKIFLSPPDVGDAERKALLDSFDSGWIAPVGPHLDRFESQIADYVGAESCAALSSGTAALHLALQVVGVKPGDDVLVQTATFAASAFSVTYIGAKPVFIDIDDKSWCMDVNIVASELKKRSANGRLPAAVMPVDIYGLCPNYIELKAICQEYEVPIIEDAAEALGSRSQGLMAGTWGDLGIFSFNGNKIITTSCGGAVVGPKSYTDRIRFLATQTRENFRYYEHREIGFNYRMSNLLAALGSAQLSQLPSKIARRTYINQRYCDELKPIKFLTSSVTEHSNNWLTVGLLPYGVDRDMFCAALESHDIEVRPAWKPMHLQPVFRNKEVCGGGVSEQLFKHGVCLPSGSILKDSDLDRVIKTIKAVLKETKL